MLCNENKKSTNEATDTDADMIIVNNFFAHLIKEISITKYGSNKHLIPTFSPYEIYQYSNATMKHLPEDSLKKLEKTMLYSKTPLYLKKITMNRKIHNGLSGTTNAQKTNDAKHLDIDDRIDKFQDQLKDEYVYRTPLRYFTDLGEIKFLVKIYFRIKCQLATEIKKLFESRKVLVSTAAIPNPDAKIIFTKVPFIQYEQILLDKNFRKYLETIMISEKILRMGAQKVPT